MFQPSIAAFGFAGVLKIAHGSHPDAWHANDRITHQADNSDMQDLLTQYAFTPERQKLTTRIALGIYMAVIILGSIPGARAEAGEYASGWILHTLTYGLIEFLLFAGASGTSSQRALKALAVLAAMGALDEFIQSFLPYRHGQISDWFLDMASALLVSTGLVLAWPALCRRHAGNQEKISRKFVNMQAEKK